MKQFSSLVTFWTHVFEMFGVPLPFQPPFHLFFPLSLLRGLCGRPLRLSESFLFQCLGCTDFLVHASLRSRLHSRSPLFSCLGASAGYLQALYLIPLSKKSPRSSAFHCPFSRIPFKIRFMYRCWWFYSESRNSLHHVSDQIVMTEQERFIMPALTEELITWEIKSIPLSLETCRRGRWIWREVYWVVKMNKCPWRCVKKTEDTRG